MSQLREFAQHKSDFDRLNTRLIAISADDQEHARLVWEKKVDRQFPILSDPGAVVIRQYGLLHAKGKGDEDIAIRTTYLLDEQGRERWRHVSESVPEIPKAAEVLQQIQALR
jgi:peroxiredoxin